MDNSYKKGKTMSEIIYEDENLQVYVNDETGAGGACHKYSIVKREIDPEKGGQQELGYASFQNGNIIENGVNGITNEALLAIVIHRLKGFMRGPFPSIYSDKALRFTKKALRWLERRTLDRKARGVEGKEKL